MAEQDNYSLLIQKLDKFIRKYYVNQLIRGVLYSIGLILALFVAFNLLEHYFNFGKGVRKLMFFSFIGTSVIALLGWVLIPLSRYFRLGKVISHEKAANIIGDHFTNVKDKLLNILQLKQQANQSPNAGLLMAGINQKTQEINPIPFRTAINLNQNKKYLRYALPPLLLLVVLLFAAPSLITESTSRLINNDREFEKEAPFNFTVNEGDLSVVQFDNYLLEVQVDGEVLPNEVFIDIDNYKYKLTKKDATTFTYNFNNVQKDTPFKLFSSGVDSKDYNLDVLLKPNIAGFDIKLDYPAYTKRKDEELSNIGDLVVPVGTNIDWVFNSLNTDNINIRFSNDDKIIEASRFDDDLFTYKKRALKDQSYKLYVSNNDLPNADSVVYAITVVPDLHPTINVEKFVDSTDSKLIFFVGQAADDYGLLNLNFNYRIKKDKNREGQLVSVPMQKPDNKQIQYTHTFDIELLELGAGDEISYYFEVFDNDAVNGSKSAKTNIMNFSVPTVEEFEELADKNNDEIKKDLEEAVKESKKIQEEMKKLREEMLQKKEMDWQDREELQKLLDRQKEIEKAIEDAKENFKENMENQEEFSKPNEELLKKQEQIEKMMEEVMSDEMKELMEQIEELMQELNRDNAMEMMEEMEMNEEEMEMEMDRMLELFKQLEVEAEMERAIEKLEELAERQEELSEETEEGETPQEELEEKQEEINEEFEKLQEDMEETEKKNEELERPKDMEDQEEQMEDIEQDLDDSQENLEKQENSKASESQKKAAQKMQEMAESMQMQMQSSSQDQMEEDMDALRQLLENLVNLSFDQEDVIADIKVTNPNTPVYVDLVQEQYKLKDDFRLIEDSLVALSKRVYQIESFVMEKVTDIKSNMKTSLEELEERKKQQAAGHQQRTMTYVNDLALMLSEVMDQMQQQMSGQMPGSQMCNKPGGGKGKGKVPMDKIGQGQQGLGEQLKQMKENMKSGKGNGSKDFAQAAAKQAALRKALRELQKEKQGRGEGASQELQEIMEQMNKTETDLVNKRLTSEMLKRQQEIETRLLQAEKAERQREYDNKRKAEVATEKERKMPPSLEEYIKKREAEIEMFKTVSPALKPYYKFLVEEYFKSLKEG